MREKKKGFSLIELLAVLAIISILSATGLIKINIIGKAKAKNELNTLINNVYFAKEKALATSNKVTIFFYKDHYIIKQKDGLKVDEMTERYVDLKYISKRYAASEEVVFNPSGSVENAGKIAFDSDELCKKDEVIYLVVGVAGGSSRIYYEKIQK